MKVLLFLFMLLNLSFAKRLISTGEIETLFTKALANELNDEDAQLLKDVIEIFQRPEHVSARSLDFASETRNTLDCVLCRSAFSALFTSVQNGQTDDSLSNVIGSLCYFLGIENQNVCRGAVKLNMPILTYIIRNTPEATPSAFCSLVLQNVNNPNVCPSNDPRMDWTVDLPAPPDVVTNNATTSQDPLTIAIFTDAHIDPLYEAFGVANCDEPVCCRKGQRPAIHYSYKSNIDESFIEESVVQDDGDIKIDLDVVPKIRQMKSMYQTRYPVRNVEPAGYWGDYRNCDSPIWAYDDVVDTIAENHKNVDVIYYIGDTIDHGVWETTYELINDINRHAVDKLRQTFGDDVLVVPVIGNHESQPTNQFAPTSVTEPYVNTTWLYEALVKKWDHYLTDEARETLLKSGSFSVLVRPGLRAISLNNNIAYRYNWWIVYDPQDSKRELDWLIQELYKSERAGEKVHIIAHIPPGVHDLTHTWTREYNRIVNRFTSTIKAEFNGHTHSDEFKIFYNDQGTPVNVAWGSGSATSFTFYNLNYKIVTFSTDTFEPLSIQNYVYNLTEANLSPNRRPHWFQLYDMKNTFGLNDLSPASMDDLVRRMVTTNTQLMDIYSAFHSKLSDSRMPFCNIYCKLDQVCRTVITVLWDRNKCNEIMNLYNSQNHRS